MTAWPSCARRRAMTAPMPRELGSFTKAADDLQLPRATAMGKVLPFEFVVDGERRTVQLRGSATVSHADAYVACCEAGLGFVQLPRYHVQQPLDGGTLREVLRAHRPPPMPVSVMYPHH